MIVNRDFDKFDEIEMRQFGKILFGSIADIIRAYPCVNRHHSLKEFRKMFATYTIVGKTPGFNGPVKFVDKSRKGIIHPMTERTLFLHLVCDEHFGKLLDIKEKAVAVKVPSRKT